MSASPEFIEYVRELLLPLGELTDGKFFGGFAFKSCAKQFAMIMGDTLYFCVNNETRPKYQAIGMKSFAYSTKKGVVEVKKYYSVPEDLFEDPEKLIIWARTAIEASYSK